MLKKQTVWLLTMLSLMIVLSIYYMTSDSEDLAYINNGAKKSEEAATTKASENGDGAEVDEISPAGEDELFTTIRMELQDKRSMEKDRLKEVVASSSTSTDEKNEAMNDMKSLDDLAAKETILQDSILSASEYEDVLVRSDDSKVHVHVKVDELSKEEVVDIMQMVRDEFGEVTVDVNFQPTES